MEGVPSHVKHELEEQAMESFLTEMLGGEGNTDARERFRSLWTVNNFQISGSILSFANGSLVRNMKRVKHLNRDL